MIDLESENMNETNTMLNGVGERLRSAREAMSLSIKDAATHLHLSVHIIDIIEKENFKAGPPPTFMRGYVRSYARFLNVPDYEISKTLQELETTVPIKSTSLPILQTRPRNRSDRYLHWMTYGIIITLIIMVGLWWHSHQQYMIADVPTKTTPAAQQSSVAPSSSVNTDISSANAPAAAGSNTTPPTPSVSNTATTENTSNTVQTQAPAAEKSSTLTIPSSTSFSNGESSPTTSVSQSSVQTLPGGTSAEEKPSVKNTINNSTNISSPTTNTTSVSETSSASEAGTNSNAETPTSTGTVPGNKPLAAETPTNASETTQTQAQPLPSVEKTDDTSSSNTSPQKLMDIDKTVNSPPPQVDTPPIISATAPITLSPTQAPEASLSTTKPTHKHKHISRHATLPGMPGVSMALPEPN